MQDKPFFSDNILSWIGLKQYFFWMKRISYYHSIVPLALSSVQQCFWTLQTFEQGRVVIGLLLTWIAVCYQMDRVKRHFLPHIFSVTQRPQKKAKPTLKPHSSWLLVQHGVFDYWPGQHLTCSHFDFKYLSVAGKMRGLTVEH